MRSSRLFTSRNQALARSSFGASFNLNLAFSRNLLLPNHHHQQRTVVMTEPGTIGSAMATKGYSANVSTPSFPDAGNLGEKDIGPIEQKPTQSCNVEKDLHGPWIMLGGPLQGELFVEKDGFCFFRPGKGLGQGVGHISLKKAPMGVTFRIDLECYLYETTSRDPPNTVERFTMVGLIQIATAAKDNYRTFTLSGNIQQQQQANNGQGGQIGMSSSQGRFEPVGNFTAAKLEPWDESLMPKWAPNRVITEGFQQLFPHPIHLARKQKPPLALQQYKVGHLPNVYYVPNYVSEEEEQQCLAQLAATPKELKNQLDRRVVQEYGCSMCETCNKSFVADMNQPPWTHEICNSLLSDKIFSPAVFPNNVRIHEYEVGHGIAPHVDGPIYVPRVAILSLASSVVMGFFPKQKQHEDVMEHYNDTFKFDGPIAKQKPEFSLVLEPRSLLIFERDAYNTHPHGISDRASDSLDEAIAGPIANRHLLQTTPKDATEVKRQYRVGITIRHLMARCNDQPSRAEYCMKDAWKTYVRQPGGPNPKELVAGDGASASSPAIAGSVATALGLPQRPQLNNNINAPSGGGGVQPNLSRPPLSGSSSNAQPQTAAAPVVGGGNNASSLSSEDDRQMMRQILRQQTEIMTQLREMQLVLAHNTTSAAQFRQEVSSVLDHMSNSVLEMSSKVDQVVETQEADAKKSEDEEAKRR